MTTLKSLSSKKGKKGFTLTELAIVIAVIAILIAVLVPTFSSIITKAKVSNESVACKNEWTNFYIDADIAANGTSDDYLVVYTDNSYSDSNGTYYHGYLATAGVYDTETQYNVTIASSGIATCDGNQYKPIGSYDYMAGDDIMIFTNSTEQATVVTDTSFSGTNPYKTTSYTIANDNLTISGYGDTYYVTGTFSSNSTAASNIFNTDSLDVFYIRVYYPLSCSDIAVVTKLDYASGSNDNIAKCWYTDGTTQTAWTDSDATSWEVRPTTENVFDNDSESKANDKYAYTDFTLRGDMSKYVIKYYTSKTEGSTTSYTLAGTITIYNNATPSSNASQSTGS